MHGFYKIAPRQLCCLRCHNGGCKEPPEDLDFNDLAARLRADPDMLFELECAFDRVGMKTEQYGKTSPEKRKRDLDVLYKLGYVPGDIRAARDIFINMDSRIETVAEICACGGDNWQKCPHAYADYYEKGKKLFEWAQTPDVMAKEKTVSCAEIEDCDEVRIRPHHMLCLLCFEGRDDNDRPLAEDNLYEAMRKIKQNPDIILHLVDGPERCMICPPCHAFDKTRGTCVALCHLRDRKKDLETLCRLGYMPNQRVFAHEAYARIRERIKSPRGICGLNSPNQVEWADCGGVTDGRFEMGYKKLFGDTEEQNVT